MPHINSRGQIAHGVGGALASVDNVPFAKGGVGGWITDDEVLFADGNDDSWEPCSYNVHTQEITPLSGGGGGAAVAYGSGTGHWAVAGGPAKGIRASTGFVAPDAGLMGMGPDGTLGYKPQYHSHGPTVGRDLVLEQAIRQAIQRGEASVDQLKDIEWEITPGHTYSLQLLDERRAIWMEGFNVRVQNLPIPLVADTVDVWAARAAFCGGEWWITYYSAKHGIVLHPFDSFEGFVVLASGNGWHNLRAISPDAIRVAVSRGEGEQPGDIWFKDFDVRTDARQDVRHLIAMPIPPINRELWVGFFDGNTSVPTGRAPGNCFLAGRKITGPQDRPFINAGGTVTGQKLGAWVQGDSVEEIERLAKTVPHPVAYWDARDWPRLPSLPQPSWLCFQAYCRVTETVAQFDRDMRRVLDGAPRDHAWALVAQCYTSNTNNTSDLKALVPIYAQLAVDYPNIKAILVFSGYGRATGYQDHPEVHSAWQTLAASVQQPQAQVPTGPPLRQPVVTVRTWTLDELLNGREFVVEDTNNATLGYRARIFVRDGSMYAEIVNAGGSAQTGLKRPVRKTS